MHYCKCVYFKNAIPHLQYPQVEKYCAKLLQAYLYTSWRQTVQPARSDMFMSHYRGKGKIHLLEYDWEIIQLGKS